MKKTILTLTAVILSLSCFAMAESQPRFASSDKSKFDQAHLTQLHEQLHRAIDAAAGLPGKEDPGSSDS